jgi:hypothetical protein
MKLSPISILLIASSLILGCHNSTPTSPSNGNDILYSNSFESSADTVGWSGYGDFRLYASAPPGGGTRSLRVSGGCIVPHASKRIVVSSSGGTFGLRCWAKNLSLGGGVQLFKSSDPFHGLSIQVSDTTWTALESSGSLACSPTDTLVLTFCSGGIVASAMLVDEVRIYRVQ